MDENKNEQEINETVQAEETEISEEKNTEYISENTDEIKPKKKRKKLKIFLIILSSFLALVIAAGVVGNILINRFLNQNLNRDPSFNENNLEINSNAFNDTPSADEGENKYENSGDYINIALFGIDTRDNVFKGRSDSIIILTIDKKRNKIKMTSLARDSYVPIDGHGKNKLGHAFAYGRAELAVRTINQVYNMDIRDYVAVNFFGFKALINYIGGIDINVSQSVLDEVNRFANKAFGLEYNDYDKIPGTGMQRLDGSQALAYARTRHNTGGDLARAGRQREVLDASLEKVRELGIGRLTEFAKIGLQNTQTSLTVSEIKSLGAWAILNRPTIETYAVPDKDCHPKSGKDAYIGKTWFYIYDLDVATRKIHDFIKEEGTYIKK